jgi:cell division protein FtsB
LKAQKKSPYQGAGLSLQARFGMSAKSKNSDLPLVATANDLRTGAVVYRGADGAWQRDIARAEIAEGKSAADNLQQRAEADLAVRVADLALIPIVRDGAFVRPAALREIIRATGPTIELPSSQPRL